MGDPQLELICYGSYPWVTLCLKHLLWASQVQITYRERDKIRISEGVQVCKSQKEREKGIKKIDSMAIQVTVLMWHIVAHKGPN